MPGGCQNDEKGFRFRQSAIRKMLCQIRAHGLIDSCAWAHDVHAPKFFSCGAKHPLKLGPFSDICLLEYCSGSRARLVRIAGNNIIGLGAEGKVRN